MNVIWYKVWFDLWNNKVRTVPAILSIAAGVFAIGAIFGMIDQLLSTMDQAHQSVNPSHISLFLNRYIDHDTAARLKSIKGVEGVEVVNSVSVRYKPNPEDDWQPGLIVKAGSPIFDDIDRLNVQLKSAYKARQMDINIFAVTHLREIWGIRWGSLILSGVCSWVWP